MPVATLRRLPPAARPLPRTALLLAVALLPLLASCGAKKPTAKAPPTPEVRAAVERRIEAAAVGAWLAGGEGAGSGASAGGSGRMGRVSGSPGMAVNLAAIARIVAAVG